MSGLLMKKSKSDVSKWRLCGGRQKNLNMADQAINALKWVVPAREYRNVSMLPNAAFADGRVSCGTAFLVFYLPTGADYSVHSFDYGEIACDNCETFSFI
eukprot:IDg7715t1